MGRGSGNLGLPTPLFLPNSARKEVSRVIRASEVVFLLQRQDVIACARELGIPEEAITDDVLHQVKKGVEFGLECWTDVVKEALKEAIVIPGIKK